MVSNINSMYHHLKAKSVSQSICLSSFRTIFVLWVQRERAWHFLWFVITIVLQFISVSVHFAISHANFSFSFSFYHFTRYNIVFLAFTYGIPMAVMIICYYVMGRELWGSQSIGENTERQTESVKSKKKVSMETFIIYQCSFTRSFIHLFVLLFFSTFSFVIVCRLVVLSVQMDVCEPYERCSNGAKMILQRWHTLLHIWNLTSAEYEFLKYVHKPFDVVATCFLLFLYQFSPSFSVNFISVIHECVCV